jgi:hypothetical protein
MLLYADIHNKSLLPKNTMGAFANPFLPSFLLFYSKKKMERCLLSHLEMSATFEIRYYTKICTDEQHSDLDTSKETHVWS